MTVLHKVFQRQPRVKRHWREGVLRESRNSSIEKRIDDFKNDLLNRFLVSPY